MAWIGRFAGAGLALVVGIGAAFAEDAEHHGLSLFGSLKYPAGFERFDYVNPDAPKGGTLRYASIGSFDSLNPFIVKGRSAAGISTTH